MYYLLPLIKKIKQYSLVIEVTFDPEKLYEWWDSIPSPFIGIMVKTHFTDLAEEVAPYFDEEKKIHFKSAMGALIKHNNPIPLIIFLNIYSYNIPVLYGVIKSLRHVNHIFQSYLHENDGRINTINDSSNGTNFSSSNDSTGSSNSCLPRNDSCDSNNSDNSDDNYDTFEVIGWEDLSDENQKEQKEQQKEQQKNQKEQKEQQREQKEDLEIPIIEITKQFISDINSVDIPSWSGKGYSLGRKLSNRSFGHLGIVKRGEREESDNMAVEIVSNCQLRKEKSLTDSTTDEKTKIAKSVIMVNDVREELLSINYSFLDLLQDCKDKPDFFEEFETWLSAFSRIITDFVFKSRDYSKMNNEAIPVFREEMKRYENTFKPMINKVMEEYALFHY